MRDREREREREKERERDRNTAANHQAHYVAKINYFFNQNKFILTIKKKKILCMFVYVI